MAYLQIPSLTNPLVTPWDQFVASGATGTAEAAGASSISSLLPYLGIAEFLLNPPTGPRSVTQIGSPTQGAEPMVVQQQSWLPTAMGGGLQGAMAGGIPFGLPGAIIGGLTGFGLGAK
jgi:hypothetical protein